MDLKIILEALVSNVRLFGFGIMCVKEGILAAGLCMGIGALGPALGEGKIGAAAMEAIAKNSQS